MNNKKMEPKLLRLLDANINRLKEGIRVVEDIYRYIFDDKEISAALKEIRHRAFINLYKEALKQRETETDVLRDSIQSELKRDSLEDIVISNFKRAQESARVLEESLKLADVSESEKFKQIRYELYRLEKVALAKPSR